MSGIGGLGPSMPYKPVNRLDRDGSGSGGGGQYLPPERRKKEEHEDEAELSEEAKKKLEHIKMQEAAKGNPESNDARLHILNEVKHFNETHERARSPLRAALVPDGKGNQVLHVRDPRNAADLKPFGERDIFHLSPQEVRTRLEAFDHSSGSNFDFTA
ncbi:MAG: hypothetical protein KDB07_01205 [Planctomycetes bacterium]|nr:hypothetical protein [Planctomycetota bacterium]